VVRDSDVVRTAARAECSESGKGQQQSDLTQQDLTPVHRFIPIVSTPTGVRGEE
jgi:hypothetical protein